MVSVFLLVLSIKNHWHSQDQLLLINFCTRSQNWVYFIFSYESCVPARRPFMWCTEIL